MSDQEEAISEEEVEDEDYEENERKKPAKRRSRFVEEEADEDDDDEDEGGAGGRKRRKASRFIDDIAAVDSDEEEEEADEDVDDMLAHNDEDLGGEELGAGGDAAAHYRELDALRQRQGARQEQTEEELAKYYEDKYKSADLGEDSDYEAYGDEEDVGQQGLQPTREDPGLFIVACRLGCEREACLQLLQKCYNYAERGLNLGIKCAVCLDHLKGFLYVEADKDSYVLEAIKGLRTIYPSKGARLVPLKERPAAITVNRQAKAAIGRDSWVRVRGGLYKDDLAKVIDVDYAGGRATVKLVPRLDLQAMAKDHMGGARRNPFGRQAVRPPPRPFRSREAGELGLPVGKDRNDPAVITLNTHRFMDGHTIRTYTLKGLILQDVAPPLDEIARFNQAGQTAELDNYTDPAASLQQLLKALPDGSVPKATYVKGDRVLVIAGDLNTLTGTVEDVSSEHKVFVRPDLMREQVVELELDEVQKLFNVGDHVRVLSGPHAGEAGMVVRVMDGMCILLPDTRQGELKVFVRDLAEHKTDTNTGVASLGGKYELHDLVQLDATKVGVIIGIDKDMARVLTNLSTPRQQHVQLCKESDIMRKLLSNRASAPDISGVIINTGDYVTLVDALAGIKPPGAAGVKSDKGGVVHAISRSVVFIKSPDFSDQGGFIVARSNQVRLRGNKAAPAAAGAGALPGTHALPTPMHDPSGRQLQAQGSQALGLYGPQSAAGAYGGWGGGGRGRGRGHASALQGAEVTVKSGPYARYKGRIKQETNTHLQLELDAINRVVTVKKSDVLGSGGYGGGRLGGLMPGARPPPGVLQGFNPLGRVGGPPRTPAHVMQTPLHPSAGSATPLHPGRTPMHPLQTPMHPSMTPARGTATPLHPSMTPAHPSMTPAHPSMDEQDGYGRDARRQGPAAAATGVYGSGGSAPVSTPGGIPGYVPAPTPGTAETPGVNGLTDPGNAQTPGLMASTPGGGDGYVPGPHVPGQSGHNPKLPGRGGAAAAYVDDNYHPEPAHSMGATPGTVQTPGLQTGYTPIGVAPPAAFTPGYEFMVEGGLDGGGSNLSGASASAPKWQYPDYKNVLVKLPGSGVGVGGSMRPSGELEVQPVEGGDVVLLEVVELVPVQKKDKVKAVSGERQGHVGEVILFDGSDAVLLDGVVIDRSLLGKLKE